MMRKWYSSEYRSSELGVARIVRLVLRREGRNWKRRRETSKAEDNIRR